jgi:T5SS/PEP-CTERM-associated repeat protein
MKKSLLLAAVLCASTLLAPVSRAQDLYVGSNSSGVTTNFTSGTNAYDNTYVGYRWFDNSNTLNVLNTNTLLTNSGSLVVGYEGSANSLVISNGGTVADDTGTIGEKDDFRGPSSNNTVVVTGTNSLWTNSLYLLVGYQGSGNSLVISNGGTVANTAGIIGRVGLSSNNSVLVTGTDSLWTNSVVLVVGESGSLNSLVISNGGTVANNNGDIGRFGNSSNNSVLVTGAGSLWTNNGNVVVGLQTTGNSLVISDGGTVADNSGTIGALVYSSNNSVLVTGAGSLWTNSSDLYVGNEGSGNSLVISDGGSVVNSNGYIGYTNTASNNSVLVTGTGSTWTNSDDLYVGYEGSGNSLVISNGGSVVVGLDLSVGYNLDSSSNSLLVTGLGSSLTVGGGLFVSYEDNTGNTMTISDGASVSSAYGYIGAYSPDSSNNSVLVTDGGTWTIGDQLQVGEYGHDNRLVISNGGTVSDQSGYIGTQADASNNSVLVIGANSLWTNSSELSVGDYGSGNSLTVADGGTVSASEIRISVAPGTNTLNIGRLGANDAAGIIDTPAIRFVEGTGSINFNQSNAMTLSAEITGNGGVNQLGSGTTELTGYSTYTGPTAIEAGKLVVSGSISSDVTVSGTGALGGGGSVGSLTIASGGTVNPGNSPGNLDVAGNVVWSAGGNYNWQISDATSGAGLGWDLITSSGSKLDLTGLSSADKFNINLWSLSGVAPDINGAASGFDSAQSYTWEILRAAGGIDGFSADYFNINLGAINGTGGFVNTLGGGSFSLETSAWDQGQALNLVFKPGSIDPAVPEPGTWAAAALLAGGAAFARWRRRSKDRQTR